MRNAVPSAALVESAAVVSIQGGRTWGDDVPTDVRAEYKRRFPNLGQFAASASIVKGRRRIEILALSGGGSDGAFGAGILKGWSDRGDRPEFELVTGVSAGAIIAPFAFLGRDQDGVLEQLWTRFTIDDVLTPQVLQGLLGGPSLADAAPLRRMIAEYIDAAFMARIAEQYRRGRLLTIGTTNLDAKRPVVWNMGEIAVHATPQALELFRNVILASASIPGIFPPVNIKVVVDGRAFDELHVDGGVTRQVYVAPLNLPIRAFDIIYDKPPERHLYIIMNGRLTPEYDPVPLRTLPIAAQSIATLLLNQGKGDIYRIWRMARDADVPFNLLAIPERFPARAGQGDSAYQRRLFDEGVRLGRQAKPWWSEPPELKAGPPSAGGPTDRPRRAEDAAGSPLP